MGRMKEFSIEEMNKAVKKDGIQGLIQSIEAMTSAALVDVGEVWASRGLAKVPCDNKAYSPESPSGWTPLLFRDDQNGSAQWILSLTNQSSGDDMRFRLDVSAVMKLSDLAEAELVAADFFADPPSGHDDDQEGF